ncbi:MULTISPECIES: hypothetical protein [unclassified Arthrobacter]|uniref:hypothetical protein n=1 Tax=unclassified Arthrobacter TaxID=235627 RepID=UPI00339387DE
MGNLGFRDIEFPKPVFIGDTLRVEGEALDKRESKSRPDTRLRARREVARFVGLAAGGSEARQLPPLLCRARRAGRGFDGLNP